MSTTSQEPTYAKSRSSHKGTLSKEADRRRLMTLPALAPAVKSELGQFMTPAPIAEFMASMFDDVSQPEISLLDPGAGVGSLTAAFMQRACAEPKRPRRISVTAYEIDDSLADSLQLTLEECAKAAQAAGIQMTYQLRRQDFIHHASEILEGGLFVARPSYTHVITNPPYKKIQSLSDHRKMLRRAGIEATNLYAAFVALAVKLLAPNGELVAITPRSFANGPYFLPFRKILLSETSIRHIHVLETRDVAFRDDNVLQENVIYHLSQTSQSSQVIITASQGPDFQINVFHIQGQGISPALARGLALYLNATIVDKFFRLFNGHTQVNATDLRALPYPSQETLLWLGQKISSAELPPQAVIDQMVEQIVFAPQQHGTITNGSNG